MNSLPETRVRLIAEQVWQQRLARQPYLQLREGAPVTRIPAETLEDAEADARFAETLLRELALVATEGLAETDLLTRQFLQADLERQTISPDLWWAQFPVTPYAASGIALYGQMLFAAFRFEADADGERYLALVEDFARFVASLGAKVQAQAARGWRVPAPALAGVQATLTGLKAAIPGWLAVAPARVEELSAALRSRVVDGSIRGSRDRVVPEFDRVLDFLLGDYARLAPSTVGLSQYPGGEEAYRRLVSYHLTFEIAPERVHEIGLEAVGRLSERMREVRATLDFSGSERDFLNELRAGGRLHAASPEQVAQTYLRHMKRMEQAVPSYFGRLPKARWAVSRLAPAMEAGMSYGYYEPPTAACPDGVYRYNGSGLDTRSQLSAAALIFHELVPGHHFHLARQHENAELPSIRRNSMELTAFTEGWAEYASGLAGEMGLYDDPYDLYGRLVHERFVAQRLVVDTGLNLLGWPLKRAGEYMAANTLEAPGQVATETLRYSTDLPAQALAYRMGFLKFMELRERARTALGNRFDIRAFHEAILGEGALPLTVLGQYIDRWCQLAPA